MIAVSVVQLIRATHPELRKSERKVADYVLAHADDVIHMRIVDLAQEAHVSEPTVVRFCRAIGYNSFQAFKVALAQYVAHYPRSRLERSGPAFSELTSQPPSAAASAVATAADALARLRECVDLAALEAAAACLASARCVAVFGVGLSGIAALELQRRLVAAGVAALNGSETLLLHADHLPTAADVAVLVSGRGDNAGLLATAARAGERTVRTVGIGPLGSPLLAATDLAVATGPASSDDAGFAVRAVQLTLTELIVQRVTAILDRAPEAEDVG